MSIKPEPDEESIGTSKTKRDDELSTSKKSQNVSETNLIVVSENENENEVITDCGAQEEDKAGKGAASSIS